MSGTRWRSLLFRRTGFSRRIAVRDTPTDGTGKEGFASHHHRPPQSSMAEGTHTTTIIITVRPTSFTPMLQPIG
ncbi:hypothetical protein JZ785_12580 [Alicyclobacillus curvatus]|nr:hypothetical protein JZ785_12580 [Alicyclobacillus curvatus]